jgi:hypothetical protein
VAEGSYPAYPSVEKLARTADLVVDGTIGRTIGDFADRGGEPERYPDGTPSPVRPMLFLEVLAETVLRGETGRSDRGLVIVVPDESKLDFREFTPFKQGQRVILFLERLPVDDRGSLRSELPGEIKDAAVYVQLSADNGAFDVSGTRAVARSHVVRGLSEADSLLGRLPTEPTKESPPAFSVELADLVAVVKAST